MPPTSVPGPGSGTVTAEEFALLLERFIGGMQLPATMSRLSQLARNMEDAGANHLAQQAMAAATAAQSDNDRLIAVLSGVVPFVEAQVAGGGGGPTIYTIYTGDVVVDWNTADANHVAISQAELVPWVTNATTIMGYIPYAALTSDTGAYFFDVKLKNITAGVSFDFAVRNTGSPLVTDYTIKWIAFIPP